jgi:predicted HicB family RNase H-like nuclease
MKYLEYKGYIGSIEYSREDRLLYGKVLGITGLISFEGTTGEELETDFREAVDSYFESCRNNKLPIEKPFKGSFNVRITTDLHQKAALLAMEEKTSLNGLVAEAIRAKVLKEAKSII